MTTEIIVTGEGRITPLARLAGYAEMSLEDIMTALCGFGHPTLMNTKRGWWCYIQMHVMAAGTSFEIKSEADSPSAIIAARQCASRLLTVLKQYAPQS